MATWTHAISTASTSNAASYTTGSFTPAANDLLVVTVVASASIAAGSVTNSSGITFTKITSALKNLSADTIYLFVANSLATAVSQTCTFDCTGDSATGAIVNVARLAGMTRTGASAVRQSAIANNKAAGIPTVTLGTISLTGNPLIGVVGNATNPAGLTPPATWTEQNDTGYITPTAGSEYATVNSGFVNTVITWGSSSASDYGIIVAEMDSSAALQTLTQNTRFDNSQTFYAHTLTPGAVALTQSSRFDNSQTFYAHTLTQTGADQTLTQSARFDNSQTFYTHTLTVGQVALEQSARFDNAQTFYHHTLNQDGGAQTLTQSARFDNAQTFYQHNSQFENNEIASGAGRPSISSLVSPTGRKSKAKRFDDTLTIAMRDIYEGVKEPEIIQQAANIVRPFVQKGIQKTAVPSPETVDWAKLEKDAEKVSALLNLWQEQLESLEDEEMCILMLAL